MSMNGAGTGAMILKMILSRAADRTVTLATFVAVLGPAHLRKLRHDSVTNPSLAKATPVFGLSAAPCSVRRQTWQKLFLQ